MNLTKNTAIKLIIITFATGLFLEMMVSLSIYYNVRSVGEQQISYNAEELSRQEDIDLENGKARIHRRGANIYLEFQEPVILSNICITAEQIPTACRGVNGEIFIRDESSAYVEELATEFKLPPLTQEQKLLLHLEGRGKVKAVSISLEGLGEAGGYFLTDITFNSPVKWHFSLVRLCFFLFVGFWFVLAFSKAGDRLFVPEKTKDRIYVAATLCIGVFLAMIIAVNVNETDEQFNNQDGNVRERNVYNDMVVSLVNGRTYLDYEVDPMLNELDNVLDYTERQSKNVIYYFDISFYNGKYYCYFGIAPVLLIYLPYYLITGSFITDAMAAMILCIISIIFLYLMLMEIIKRFKIEINLKYLLLGIAAASFSSGLYLTEVRANFHDIAQQSAVMWFFVFGFAAFKACNLSSGWKSNLYFALSGIAMAMIVASRPGITMLTLVAVPLYLEVLFSKKKTWKEKLGAVISFAIPVSIGAICLMYYNYIRFDSVFEFGNSYELSAYDLSTNHVVVTFKDTVNVILQYFCQPLTYVSRFPYISLVNQAVVDKGCTFFQDISFGAFAFPFHLLFIGGLLGIRNKDAMMKFLGAFLFGACFIIAYIDYSIGGVFFRYVCDILPGIAVLSFISGAILVDQFPKCRKAVSLICAVSICLGILMVFENERLDMQWNTSWILSEFVNM